MFFGGKIYDVVWMLVNTTSGMDAHLYYIVGLSPKCMVCIHESGVAEVAERLYINTCAL